MSSTATPYGFKPVGSLTGPYNAQFRKFKIASGYATAIYTGDPVKCVSDGTIALDSGTTTLTPLGIFLGCEYTNSVTGQKLQSPYWPASHVASDAYAFVYDNPWGIFQIQSSGVVSQTELFNNMALATYAAGSSTFGISRVVADATGATTATLPLKIIGFVEGPDSAVGDAYTDILVIWNTMGNSVAVHPYLTALGV